MSDAVELADVRISEAVAPDVDAVRILTRKGVLVVIPKGQVQREVPPTRSCARSSTSGSSSARSWRPSASGRCS